MERLFQPNHILHDGEEFLFSGTLHQFVSQIDSGSPYLHHGRSEEFRYIS
jgi:hypothetical protein